MRVVDDARGVSDLILVNGALVATGATIEPTRPAIMIPSAASSLACAKSLFKYKVNRKKAAVDSDDEEPPEAVSKPVGRAGGLDDLVDPVDDEDDLDEEDSDVDADEDDEDDQDDDDDDD